jgi:imidazolonepropionase
MRCDRIWRDVRLATMAPGLPGLGLIDRGVLACRDGRIVFVGPADHAPAGLDAPDIIAGEGRWITPGLIDCHTHLVYGGDRAHEFERRLAGVSYEEIARQGGGIVSTVTATRAASRGDLVTSALPRLDALLAEGVTTIEIKSGYGLELEAEMRQLRAARDLARVRRVDVLTTFLGAHALPPEYRDDRETYVDLVAGEMMREIAREGLADAVDGFCERIAFTPAEMTRVFESARAEGLLVKLHADQLSNQHGAALAARFEALSADHIEYTDADGVVAMAKAGTVGVLLPGAYYFLRERHLPPVDLMRRYHVPIAIATDHNPGTSPLTSILLAMNMAATQFRLTVDECLLGVTRQAARALGRLHEVGTLEAGKRCDLAIWDIERPAELVYRIGFNPLHERVYEGA